MRQPAHRLDSERLDAAMKRAGFFHKSSGEPNDKALARKMSETEMGRVGSEQIGRWRDPGPKGTTPSGNVLAELSRALRVPPIYLFGVEEMECRRAVLDQVRQMFGRTEADLIEQLQRLTPHHKTIVTGRIQGWAEALEEMERRELLTDPFEVEHAAMRAVEGAVSDEASPAAVGPAQPPSAPPR